MIYAKPFAEDMALRVAYAYEQATRMAHAPARSELGRMNRRFSILYRQARRPAGR